MTQRYSVLPAQVPHGITVALWGGGDMLWPLLHQSTKSFFFCLNFIKSSGTCFHAQMAVWPGFNFGCTKGRVQRDVYSLAGSVTQRRKTALNTINCSSIVMRARLIGDEAVRIKQASSGILLNGKRRGLGEEGGRESLVEVGPCFRGAYPLRQESDTFQRILYPDK